MSPDVLLKVAAYAVIPLVMAVIGNNLASEVIQDAKRRRMYKGVFIVLAAIGVVGTWLVEWRSDVSHTKEVTESGQAILRVQEQLTSNQLQSAQDMGYLKGRLDAALDRPTPQLDMQKFASALSASSALLIQAQVKAQSDEELKAQTIQLARDMRALESSYQSRVESALGFESMPPNATAAERNAAFQKGVAAEQQLMQQENLDFRNKFLARAITLRDELIANLGKTPLPNVPNYKLIAFDGMLAGPSPISDAADYLEMLANKLPERASKPR
jgi:uncharacterized protein YsxB (DUF464 family)